MNLLKLLFCLSLIWSSKARAIGNLYCDMYVALEICDEVKLLIS